MRITRALFAIALFSAPAFAQASGAIYGHVGDVAGAHIVGAKVLVRPAGGDAAQTVTTDAGGNFAVTVPGNREYRVMAEYTGFKKYESRLLHVAPGARVELDVSLEVENIICTVTVEQSPQAIEKPNYDIKNFLRLNEQICTGGQPTLEDLERMKAEGIKAIISLRRHGESNFHAEEESARAKELGLRYFSIPVDSNAPKDEQVEEFLKIMKDPENRPVFIHCQSANRVGAFWMIRRVLVDGWKLDDAVKEAEKIGLSNSRTREFALDYIARHSKKQ
jgi:uncharacterized protein (TIGR01244 family)